MKCTPEHINQIILLLLLMLLLRWIGFNHIIHIILRFILNSNKFQGRTNTTNVDDDDDPITCIKISLRNCMDIYFYVTHKNCNREREQEKHEFFFPAAGWSSIELHRNDYECEVNMSRQFVLCFIRSSFAYSFIDSSSARSGLGFFFSSSFSSFHFTRHCL